MDIPRLLENLRLVGTDTATVEVKAAAGGFPKTVPETLSAFANGRGGTIILGVSEAGDFRPVSGFDAVRIQEALAGACADKLQPPLRPEIQIVDLPEGQVVAAEIEPLPPFDKPCWVKSKGRYGGSFIRTGEGDRRLSEYEIDRLVEERRQPRFDEEVILEATESDLDQTLIDSLLTRRPRALENADRPTALQRLYVLRPGPDGTPHPTLAGLLALGAYPQEFFPRLTVTFAAYPGVDKAGVLDGSLRLLDRETLSGPIPALVRDAVAAVERNMRTGALVDGAFRRDVPDYPPTAVREAVTNALMHRDYSPLARGTQVQVNMYADRLEVLNPGGLFGTVTIRDLGRTGLSSARNQRLSALLEDVQLPGGGMVAENRGTGYATIQAQLGAALMPPPQPVDNISSFALTFLRRHLTQDERDHDRDPGIRAAILREVDAHGSVTTRELMTASGLSRTAVLRQINTMIDEGILSPTEALRSPRQRYRRA